MANWHFVCASPDGEQSGELTAAKGKTVTWQLDAPATAAFTLNGTHPQALLITETETDLIVFSADAAGPPLARFRGRFGSSSDSISPASFITQFNAVDYRGFLDRRILWPGSTETFTAEDQADIAWQLIADSQAQTGGELGITRGDFPETGVLRTINFAEGAVLSQLIGPQLADLSNGFDWEIDAQLRFNVFYPQRGSSGGQVLDYGGRVNGVTRTLDTSSFANAVRYSGADADASGAPLPAALEVGAIGPAGRWEKQTGDTSILDAPTLAAAAEAELARDIEVDASYELTLTPGWWTPDILWLGDTVQVVIKKGRLDVSALQRVSQIAVTIGDDGGETVVVTVGPIVRDLPTRLRLALQRISALERR